MSETSDVPATAHKLKLAQCEVVRYEDEFGHSYEIDGQPVVGVTTILGMGVPPEPGLVEWWKRNGKGEQEDVLLDAQERGSNVHAAIERLLYGESVSPAEFSRPREKKAIAAFLDFARTIQLDPATVKPEQVVAFVNGDVRFAGTLDLVFESNGKKYVLDFKTSATPSKKNSLQVQAYKAAFEQSHPDERIDACYVLYLGTNHAGTRSVKDKNGLPTTGAGWSLQTSTDGFDDFLRAYDMAIWCNGGKYPEPPKVAAYPEVWRLFEKVKVKEKQ